MASKTAVKTQRIVKPLGKLWGRSVQEMVTKAALTQARFEVRSGKHDGKDEVEVVIPVTIHMVFPRKGKSVAADGGIRCNCTFHEDSSGSVCTCVGPGAADCDCGPIVLTAVPITLKVTQAANSAPLAPRPASTRSRFAMTLSFWLERWD